MRLTVYRTDCLSWMYRGKRYRNLRLISPAALSILLLPGFRFVGVPLLSEQPKSDSLCALVLNFEIARDRCCAYIKRMCLAGAPIRQHSEFERRTIKLRLVPHYNRGAGRRGDCREFPL